MLLVQFGINNTRDVWKFYQIGLAPAARQILAKFPIKILYLKRYIANYIQDYNRIYILNPSIVETQ